MTPSRIGLIAVMLVGVRPSISFASLPTASIWALAVLNATIDGSLSTMPRPRANTQVFAVLRSIARSFEKTANAPSSTRGLRFFVWVGSLYLTRLSVVNCRASQVGRCPKLNRLSCLRTPKLKPSHPKHDAIRTCTADLFQFCVPCSVVALCLPRSGAEGPHEERQAVAG